jgi:hypothetical protein
MNYATTSSSELTPAGTPSVTSPLAVRYFEHLNKVLKTPAYSNKRKNHYIPECVQRQFAVDAALKKTWRLCKVNNTIELKSISGILYEEYIYRGTPKLGPDDYRIEELFAAIESAAAPVLDAAANRPKEFIEDVRHPTSLNRYKIAVLWASLGLRSPYFEKANETWMLAPQYERDLLSFTEDKLQIRVPPSEQSAFIDKCRAAFNWKDGILASIGPIAEDLFAKTWHFMLIDDTLKTNFVIGDEVGITVAKPGSLYSQSEHIFPITPKLALALGNRIAVGIEHVGTHLVRQINSQLVAHSSKYVVGKSEDQLRSLLHPR